MKRVLEALVCVLCAVEAPLALDATAAERILISAASGPTDDIRNGGFESNDNLRTFYSRWGENGAGFEFWRNYEFPQNRIGRNTSHTPPEGRYRGMVNSVPATSSR